VPAIGTEGNTGNHIPVALKAVSDFVFSDVPHFHVAVESTGVDGLRVGGERNGRDLEAGRQRRDGSALARVPKLRVAIIRACKEERKNEGEKTMIQK